VTLQYDGHTPLGIMPEKVPEHLEGTDEKVNNLEWICYYEDVDQLKQLLARLLSSRVGPAKRHFSAFRKPSAFLLHSAGMIRLRKTSFL
jgi:hypothetical protein